MLMQQLTRKEWNHLHGKSKNTLVMKQLQLIKVIKRLTKKEKGNCILIKAAFKLHFPNELLFSLNISRNVQVTQNFITILSIIPHFCPGNPNNYCPAEDFEKKKMNMDPCFLWNMWMNLNCIYFMLSVEINRKSVSIIILTYMYMLF